MTGVGSVAQMVEETELECLSLNIYHEARNESLQDRLQWVRSLLTGWSPLDSLTQYAEWFSKEYTGEDILYGTVASLVGFVTVSVTILTIYLLTIVL